MTYNNVKVPAHAHNRARVLSGVLGKSISAVYVEAIELLWQRRKRSRDRAMRKLEAGARP